MAPKSAPASASTVVIEEAVDPDIARCERMTSAQVDQVLRDANIDPRKTIDAVEGMVADWKRRKRR